MGIFTRIADRMDRQTNLMGAMMQRLDVDVVGAAADASGTRLGTAGRKCLACRDSDACQRWLDGNSEGYPDFCPNASFFAQHHK